MTQTNEHTESMLVRSENLDKLLALAGEVIVASSNLGLVYKNLQALYNNHDAVDDEALDSMKDLSGSTSEISSSLHRLVQSIRTVDLKNLSLRTKRLVRDMARKTGKRLRLEVEGEDTVVDKSVAEQLFDPIAHQLRNAVDHGIEDVATRARTGKPEEGTVTLRMYNTEQETFVEIEDDGAGIDLEALRQKAIKAGKITSGEPFSEEDALETMCMPGVTTVKAVTEVSGRGVGMDVVRNHITNLNGIISFKTEQDKGTTFVFRMPLVSAVNIVDALVVEAGEILYAFPIMSVVTTMCVPTEAIDTTLGRGKMLKHLGHLLPLHDLSELLTGAPVSQDNGNIAAIVIEHKGTKIALVINEFLAPQKLVIIPIDDALPIPEFSGATVMGGRRLGYIMNVPALISLAQGKRVSEKDEAEAEQDTRESSFGFAQDVAERQPEVAADKATQEDEAGQEPIGQEDTGESGEFLIETERLIPLLNEALFALESDVSNDEHMNKAFRLFHTIKGNFMMIGLPQGGATIHSVESVLDRARSNGLEITPEVVDLLMDGASYIEEVVRARAAGAWKDQPRTDILDKSKQLLSTEHKVETSAPDVASEDVSLSHEAAYRAIIYRKRRTPCYRCYVEFHPGSQPALLIACMIYRRFCDLGDVLGTVPALADIEKGMMEGKLKLFLASDIDPELLEETIDGLLREHYGAYVIELTRFE